MKVTTYRTRQENEQKGKKRVKNYKELKAGFEWNRGRRETEVEDIDNIICIEMDRDGCIL